MDRDTVILSSLETVVPGGFTMRYNGHWKRRREKCGAKDGEGKKKLSFFEPFASHISGMGSHVSDDV
jgi:hypothetical protein